VQNIRGFSGVDALYKLTFYSVAKLLTGQEFSRMYRCCGHCVDTLVSG